MAQEKKLARRYLAIKTINKKSIVEAEGEDLQRKVQRLLNERQILQHLDHPFIVTLLYFFQDETRLYFGMNLAGCGDFFTILEETNGGNGLGIVACRYYAAELCLALEYIHSLGIIYRDLKLENFLMAKDGHLVLTGEHKLVAKRRVWIANRLFAAHLASLEFAASLEAHLGYMGGQQYV